MKVDILQEELIKTLNLVSRVVANRPQLMVLSNLLIEARKEGLRVQATDLEVGMEVRMPAKVIEEGRVTVPAKTLSEFVGNLTPGKVTVILEKETLRVESGQYKGKFQTIAAEEFPTLPGKEEMEELAELAQKDLSEAVQAVVFAAAKDNLRPVLTGVLMEFGKKSLGLVATDGFRLAKQDLPIERKPDEKVNLLVPVRAIGEVARLEGEGKMRISRIVKSNQVIFEAGEIKVVTQLIDGSYPDYTKIVPKDFVSELTIDREELTQAVKAVHIFARENSNMMRWKIGEQAGMMVSAETPERGGAEVEVGIKHDGGGGEVVFNTKFILEFLNSCTTESVVFGLGEPLAPCAFQKGGRKGFLYVVMPINA